jgi:beta-lactam-binding protein with PASTA domain
MDRAAMLAVTALALIVGGGCSDDDEPAALSTTTATAVSTTTETTAFLSVADCVSTGDPTAAVPVVTGKRLRDAIRIVEESGLTVIDDEGVPEGDPVGATAVVQAQKPQGGELVPPGACVGFRTKDPSVSAPKG